MNIFHSQNFLTGLFGLELLGMICSDVFAAVCRNRKPLLLLLLQLITSFSLFLPLWPEPLLGFWLVPFATSGDKEEAGQLHWAVISTKRKYDAYLRERQHTQVGCLNEKQKVDGNPELWGSSSSFINQTEFKCRGFERILACPIIHSDRRLTWAWVHLLLLGKALL